MFKKLKPKDMPLLTTLPSLNRLLAGCAALFLLGGGVLQGESRLNKATTSLEHPSAELPIKTTADSMDFDRKTGNVIARGHVVISYHGARLAADMAQVNTETKEAHAEGHVKLNKGSQEWIAESIDYNFGTGAVQTGESRGQFENGLFFQAKSIESSDKSRYVLKNSFLTTSDYDNPGYRFQAGTILVYPHDRISFHDVVLFVGGVPVFYFPYFVYPIDDSENGINTGTQVQIGTKGNWGFFVLNSYTTRISDGVRPTFRLDYRAQRGLAGGLDLRYKAGERKDTEKGAEFEPNVTGKVRAYYADDKKAANTGQTDVVTSTKVTRQDIPRERYQVRVSQRAEITDEIYSKLKINKLSDPNFLEDYFEKEFQSEPQPDNFGEFTKWSPNTTLSVLARASVNNFYTTTERLPEARFDFKRQSLFGSPVFYEGENSVAYLSKEFANFDGLNDYHTTRVDSFHQILYPKKYFGWLNLTPRVGGRVTYYDQSRINANEPSAMRMVFNSGFEASFKATRTWSHVKDKKWDIDGLRHIIEPSVNYGFVARPNVGPSELFPFDVERSSFGINKNLVPIDFPQYTAVDTIDSRNVFRPSVRQRLQTRRDGAAWDLAEFVIYQDILADRKQDEKRFSDLFTEFETKPVKWLKLNWRGRYDYDHDQIRESTTGLTVYKSKVWQVRLSHDFFRDVGNQMGVSYAWAMNEDWTLRTDHRFDPSGGSLYEQAYGLDRDLHSWIATLSVSQLRPQNREADWRVWLSFTLKAFPEVAIDARQFGASH